MTCRTRIGSRKIEIHTTCLSPERLAQKIQADTECSAATRALAPGGTKTRSLCFPGRMLSGPYYLVLVRRCLEDIANVVCSQTAPVGKALHAARKQRGLVRVSHSTSFDHNEISRNNIQFTCKLKKAGRQEFYGHSASLGFLFRHEV